MPLLSWESWNDGSWGGIEMQPSASCIDVSHPNFLHWLRLEGQRVRFIPPHSRKWPLHISRGVIDRHRWPKKNTEASLFGTSVQHTSGFKWLRAGGSWRDMVHPAISQTQRLYLWGVSDPYIIIFLQCRSVFFQPQVNGKVEIKSRKVCQNTKQADKTAFCSYQGHADRCEHVHTIQRAVFYCEWAER